MKVQILPSAIEDLENGRDFYDQQGEGLGQYFLNSLFAEIDSLMYLCPLDGAPRACDFALAWRRILQSQRQAICSLESRKLPPCNP